MDIQSEFGNGAEFLDPLVSPPFHVFEKERLASVRELMPFTHPGDEIMLTLACEATQLCDVPIGFVSLLDAGEERFLGCARVQIERADRSVSVCAHTILEPDALVVEDLRADPRFRENPFVVGPPFLRFYAGVPMFDRSGLPIGSVCVVHVQPHEVSSKCLLALQHLAKVASAVLEARFLFAQQDRHSRAADREGRSVPGRLDALLLTMVESRSSCD